MIMPHYGFQRMLITMYHENVILLIPDISVAQLDINSNSILILIFFCIWDIFEVFLKTNVWHFWRKQDAMTLPIHKSQSSSTTIQAPSIKRFVSLFSNKLIIFQFGIQGMPCKNRMTFVSSLQSIILLDCLKKYFNLYFVIIELVAGINEISHHQ